MSKKRPHSKKHASSSAIINRRARFDYTLDDEIVAGLALTGLEVRAARNGHVQLKGAFVTVKNGELWLNNERGKPEARTVDTSPRKLLANRKQIDQLAASRTQGMTIVPTKLLTQGRFIKLVIALGKGKKRYDKRETIKRRDQDREAKRLMR